ncbi:MAG: polysaccharide biosynthesis/export family protein [Verrucomicrobiota bacterium]
MKTFPGVLFLLVALAATTLVGCKTAAVDMTALTSSTNAVESIVLREGDKLSVTFPGAENLNASQTIRRDGKITLQLAGEIVAAGLTPTQLEKKIIGAYAPQLLTKEVTVTVESSSYPVFLAGAVGHPGKILADRPLTALEAIMEAGGFNANSADLKHVRIIRQVNGTVKNFVVNLKPALQGKPIKPFPVLPHDIIYVPERFNWF